MRDLDHRSRVHARRRHTQGVTLLEVIIALTLCALGLMATASSLRTAISNEAQTVAEHIDTLTAGEAHDPAPAPPPAQPAPKHEDEKKHGGGGFWGKALNFVLDNAPVVGEVRTLLDPNASLLDKGLAVVSLASYFTPAGPAVKIATKGLGLASRAARDTKRAKHAIDAAEKAEDGADLLGAAKRKRPKDAQEPEVANGDKRAQSDEPECKDGICKVGCFAAGTVVLTEHGDRPIEQIAPGDRVWSRDPRTGVLALERVVRTFSHDATVIDLTVQSSTQLEHLTVTANHPFWVEGAGWVPAGNLESTSLLSAPEGALVAHAAASWGELTKVYNFEVEDSHTYFVGALHAWVHNDCENFDAAGKFKDPELEQRYQDYVKRKTREQKNKPDTTIRDRADWQKERDYWLNDSPTARGNRFNDKRRSEYDYNEVNLEDGKRVDSYDPVHDEIIERKATDFDGIETSTFERYLDESAQKYPPGKIIRSNKYPELDGKPLQGKHVLEVPDSNLNAVNRAEFERIAREKGFEIRYVPE